MIQDRDYGAEGHDPVGLGSNAPEVTPLDEFTAYVVQNYPSRTIIHDPKWHAPKLFRAAKHALRSELAALTREQPRPDESLIAAIQGDYNGMSKDDLIRTIVMLKRGREAWRKQYEDLVAAPPRGTREEDDKWIEEARKTLDHLSGFLQHLGCDHAVPWRDWIDNARRYCDDLKARALAQAQPQQKERRVAQRRVAEDESLGKLDRRENDIGYDRRAQQKEPE